LTAYQCLSPHVTAESKVLVIGASGGTGHVMTQMAQCLGSSYIVAVCSKSNFDFCQSHGATHMVDYSDRDAMMQELQQHGPFDIVVDCVSSADPRDASMGYPTLLQTKEGLLSKDYVYRRLGGPSFDWIRAGLQRTMGLQWWSNPHDQLFWIRFPKSHDELKKLKQWAEEGKLKPHVGKILGLDQVPEAFEMILSRRLQGKVVIKITSPDPSQEE
jgi:NADPH:quinone reductase-like Zn-dependent oxidoreductase